MSSLLHKTLNNGFSTNKINEKYTKSPIDNDNSTHNEEIEESYEIPPERDLRDTQPTISVNYRVIKDNFENEFKDRDQKAKKTQYQDDWNNNDSEW